MPSNEIGGLRAYLRDIGKHPLLGHPETIRLFRAMRDVEDDLEREQIRLLLVNSNLRLVVSIAKKYKDQGIPLIDLIQEGNMGLMEGVKRFDPERGFRLSTYASYWIKQAIRRHLTEASRTVRLPSHVVALLPRIRAERRRFIDEMGTEPEIEEIAAAVEATADSVRAALGASGPVLSVSMSAGDAEVGGRRGVANASRLEKAMQQSASWEGRAVDLEEETLAGQLRNIVRSAFASLTAREEQVLRLRFGVMEDPDSDDFQLTDEEKKVLKKRKS